MQGALFHSQIFDRASGTADLVTHLNTEGEQVADREGSKMTVNFELVECETGKEMSKTQAGEASSTNYRVSKRDGMQVIKNSSWSSSSSSIVSLPEARDSIGNREKRR